MRSRIVVPLAVAGVVAGVVVAIGALTSEESPSRERRVSAAEQPMSVVSGHVHGVARHPGGEDIYLATHHGLYVLSDSGAARRVGPVIDLMGFTVTTEGRLLASGHPGMGTDLPQPVGLIESADGGTSWAVRSRGGQSDFHALSQSSTGVLGYDGALRSSTDGRTWRTLEGPQGVTSLGASPDGATVLAATGAELYSSSTFGGTWDPVPDAPALVMVDWADATRVVGVDRAGMVHLSTDAGLTWTATTDRPLGPLQAVGASIVNGRTEVLAVTRDDVLISRDEGGSFSQLG